MLGGRVLHLCKQILPATCVGRKIWAFSRNFTCVREVPCKHHGIPFWRHQLSRDGDRIPWNGGGMGILFVSAIKVS